MGSVKREEMGGFVEQFISSCNKVNEFNHAEAEMLDYISLKLFGIQFLHENVMIFAI